MLFDMRVPDNAPVARSVNGQPRHSEAVWGIEFLLDQDSASQRSIVFNSIGADGLFMKWTWGQSVLTGVIETELKPDSMTIGDYDINTKTVKPAAVTFADQKPNDEDSLRRMADTVAFGLCTRSWTTLIGIELNNILRMTCTCITMHPSIPRLAMIGTEEGKILRWSPVLSM